MQRPVTPAQSPVRYRVERERRSPANFASGQICGFDAIAARDEEKADRVLRKHFSIGDNYRHNAAVEPARINAPRAERAVRATHKGKIA
jgi:hypothetical protein